MNRIKKEDLSKLTKAVEEARALALSETGKSETLQTVRESEGKLLKEVDNVRNYVGNLRAYVEEELKKTSEARNYLAGELANVKKVAEQKQSDKASQERISKLENILRGISNSSVENEARLSTRIKEWEDKIGQRVKAVERRMFEVNVPGSTLESQIGELVERMIFLETKLSAVEMLMQDEAIKHPIILE